MSAKHKRIQFAQPPEVFVIIYHERDYEYVGMDVFDSFNAALDQFDERRRATQDDHPNDPNWIENQVRDAEKQELYFCDKAGYEVFLRRETVQSKARHELKCHYCGRWHKRDRMGKDIFVCSNPKCNRPFCADCFSSMCGGTAEEETVSGSVLCPQCLLESSVRSFIREMLPDYFNRMPESFYQDVLMDVQETSGYNCEGGFNAEDIRLAFARVVAKRFGVEV